tara:strand:- start:4402 stop:4881 length:480 start_codon:yes stop_codon:yes gene_type:complete
MTQNKIQSIYKSIVSTHLIILILTTLIIGIVYTIRKNGELTSNEDFILLELLVPLIAVSSFLVSHFIGKKKLNAIYKRTELQEKLSTFKQVKVIQWVSLFGSVILASVSFLTSGQQNLLLYAMMIGVMILYFRPIKARVIEDLNLSPEESDAFTQTDND